MVNGSVSGLVQFGGKMNKLFLVMVVFILVAYQASKNDGQVSNQIATIEAASGHATMYSEEEIPIGPRPLYGAFLEGWQLDQTWEGEPPAEWSESRHWSDFATGRPNLELSNIVYCESRMANAAQNPYSTAAGLGQLLDLHAPKFAARGWDYWKDRYDPHKNRAITEEIYDRQGHTPWLMSVDCWFVEPEKDASTD